MSQYVVITPAPTSATPTIPEYTTDPASPPANSAWVLRTGGVAGSPIGLLLSLTYPGYSYQLSYRTTEGTTVRVFLT